MSIFTKGSSNIPLIAVIIVVSTVLLTIAATSFVWQFFEGDFKSCYGNGGTMVDKGWHSECVYPEGK